MEREMNRVNANSYLADSSFTGATVPRLRGGVKRPKPKKFGEDKISEEMNLIRHFFGGFCTP